MELDFDATKVFGNHRSKRYALVVEDGKVKYVDLPSYLKSTRKLTQDHQVDPHRE